MEISVVGIDLAKDSFAVCEMTKSGKVIRKRTLSRKALVEYGAKLKPTLVAFEACGGSHHWARVFKRQGHEVKVMQVQRVKAFAPPHKKNDSSDAEAIGLAALSSGVPSVRTKSVEQQDLDMLLNYRDQLVKQRVALINQAHAIALEYGVMLPKSKSPLYLERILSELESAANELTTIARELINELLETGKQLSKKADQIQKRFELMMRGNQNCELLKSIPGVGILTAVAILAHTGGDVSSFDNGRQFAAYLGLVPRQHSTGGKTKLVGITRCGQSQIRRLLVVGMNSVLRLAPAREDRLSKWAQLKRETRGYKKANIALANKVARIAFGVLSSQEPYRAA